MLPALSRPLSKDFINKGKYMFNYKITYSTESGRFCVKTFSGESEGEVIEAFEFWAEGANQILQFEEMEEIA